MLKICQFMITIYFEDVLNQILIIAIRHRIACRIRRGIPPQLELEKSFRLENWEAVGLDAVIPL
jgi:hypothetical protein